MNAKFLEKLIVYRFSYGLSVSKILIKQKIQNQFSSINKTSLAERYKADLEQTASTQNVLLIEARAAKHYWDIFRDSVNLPDFRRIPHAHDPCNILLDIGYHYTVGEIIKVCQEQNVPTELGFFHHAHSSKAHPFVYDCVEWVRPLVVDVVVRKIFRQKKKIFSVKRSHITHLISEIKHKLERKYFHRELGYCITLRYWITLFFLDFEASVNNNFVFDPLFPSLRHETRCGSKKKPPRLEV